MTTLDGAPWSTRDVWSAPDAWRGRTIEASAGGARRPGFLRLLATGWRAVDRCMTVVAVLACLLLATVAAGELLGYRMLVVETGSMVPSLRVGDLVLDRDVRPTAVRPGEIVTFKDVLLGGRLVTHRVVRMVPDGPVVHFTTKGDANRVPEHWSVPRSGTIGRELLDVRAMGYVVADLGTRTADLAVIWLLAVYLAATGARWIWRRPTPVPGTGDVEDLVRPGPTARSGGEEEQAAPAHPGPEGPRPDRDASTDPVLLVPGSQHAPGPRRPLPFRPSAPYVMAALQIPLPAWARAGLPPPPVEASQPPAVPVPVSGAVPAGQPASSPGSCDLVPGATPDPVARTS